MSSVDGITLLVRKGNKGMASRDRRSGDERRRVIERRLVNDFTRQGAQRRKILDRRCGIDRRQIVEGTA